MGATLDQHGIETTVSNGSGMLIVNADDWGGWRSATDAAAECYLSGRITSVSAMVFMEDSERAATLARAIGVDVGLHLNFNQAFTGENCAPAVSAAHGRVRRFLRRGRYAQLIYNPSLRADFRSVYQAQVNEFCRLYGRAPVHFDGHQHMHLCLNALLDGFIPSGQKVRRSFSFWPGEKSLLNRAYRSWVDGRLTRRYAVTDYFFALSQCIGNPRIERVVQLARTSKVELMTHPEKPDEYKWLMSDNCRSAFRDLQKCSYAMLSRQQ
jgi:predicted glycoside hydrolase/deacetylase ChbG (UPF0249 family)